MKDDKPFILIGGSGSETTQTGIFQVLLNMIEWGMDPQLAITYPRSISGDSMHFTGGTALGLEPELWDRAERLAEMGHDIVPKENSPAWLGFRPMVGHVQAIMIDGETGTYAGGGDPRVEGHVSGY